MSKLAKLAGLLVATSILCSCASVCLQDTWRNPSIKAEKLHRILVVSITRKESSRRVYEDMMVSELSRRGVEAVAGSAVMPPGAKPDRQCLDAAIKETSPQAVMTLQTIRVEQQTTVQPGYVTTYPGHWYPEAFPAWDLYGYYGSMANYGPAYISTYDVATMQVNLFDAATGKLLWAATLESNEPEKITSVGKDMARIIAERLAREGLI